MEIAIQPTLDKAPNAGNSGATPPPAPAPLATADQLKHAKQAAEKVYRNSCGRCGSKDLHPQNRNLLHKLFCIHVHLCLKCSTPQTKFRFHPLSLITIGTLAALLYGTVYLYRNPLLLRPGGAEAERATAESLARARAHAGGLSSFEEMMIKRPKTSMDNAGILKLWKADVGTEVITKLIETSVPDYDLSAPAIIELRQQGVDQSIILAMINTTYSSNAR